MKDTEFKAKNNDINFQKQKKADTVIGRVHQEKQKQADGHDTTQKRNKKYQHFSNDKEPQREQTELKDNKHSDRFSETSNIDVSADSVNAEPKADEAQQTVEQPAEPNFDIPENTAKEFTPNTTPQSVTSEKHKSYKKAVQRQQMKKANAPETLPPPQAPKAEQYDFQAAASDKKEYFDRTSENIDFQFERKGHADQSEHQNSAENESKIRK